MVTKEIITKKLLNSKFNSTGSGHGSLYQELPFKEFDDCMYKSKRENNQERLDLMVENLGDLNNKVILDIGCNLGYFVFKLAEKGALCCGIDADEESIEIANMLKEYYKIKNVEFINSTVNNNLINEIKNKYSRVDIVLLLSVNHWLLSSFHSVSKLELLMRSLVTKNQILFYEPSYSKSLGGYYPETTTPSYVKNFIRNIGYTNIKYLGKTNVSNIGYKRDLWMAELQFNKMTKHCLDLMISSENEMGNNVKLKQINNEFKYDKIKGRAIGFFNNYFIRIVDKNHPRFFSYENEANILIYLRGTSYVSYYYFSSDIQQYRIYFYSKIDAKPLTAINSKKFYPNYFIDLEERLFDTIDDLKRKKIIFRDIRPDNILYNDKLKILYLVDFQWARFESEEINFGNRNEEAVLNLALENIKNNGYCILDTNFSHTSDLLTAQNVIQKLKISKLEKISKIKMIFLKFKKYLKVAQDFVFTID